MIKFDNKKIESLIHTKISVIEIIMLIIYN